MYHLGRATFFSPLISHQSHTHTKNRTRPNPTRLRSVQVVVVVYGYGILLEYVRDPSIQSKRGAVNQRRIRRGSRAPIRVGLLLLLAIQRPRPGQGVPSRPGRPYKTAARPRGLLHHCQPNQPKPLDLDAIDREPSSSQRRRRRRRLFASVTATRV